MQNEHRGVAVAFPSRCVCVRRSVGQSWKLRPVSAPVSRQEGVFGGGLVHQSLHRDAHLHQALLLQDVVRETQFVLGGQRRRKRRRRKETKERRSRCRGRKETTQDLDTENTLVVVMYKH